MDPLQAEEHARIVESSNNVVYFASQAMTDGIGPMSSLPPFLAKIGVKVGLPLPEPSRSEVLIRSYM